MIRILAASTAVITLSACATMPSAPPPPPPPPLGAPSADGIPYTCADGTSFVISFTPDAAIVTLADGTQLQLKQQPVASGMWYTSGKHEFRGKGSEATWGVGRMVPTQCKTD
ncbi:MliC family protein [Asticcacaulis endophyticus]|uniref:MliC family protein n=1 Tax=Asticcacaulis endophyticus TaxID=1395890 RepID=UPI0016779655|nr:MliC family protein [Asticcacaulis endophyticus]